MWRPKKTDSYGDNGSLSLLQVGNEDFASVQQDKVIPSLQARSIGKYQASFLSLS